MTDQIKPFLGKDLMALTGEDHMAAGLRSLADIKAGRVEDADVVTRRLRTYLDAKKKEVAARDPALKA